MSIEKTLSKAKGVGNRVVWTSREPLYVPYHVDGLLTNGQEFGMFRVTGRDLYCMGFRADFGVPAGDANIQCNVGLYNAADVLVPDGRLYLNGVSMGGDKIIRPPVAMPVSSLWKFKLEIQTPDGSEEFYPQEITITYHLRYAPGPVQNRLFVTNDPQQGIGFDQVGTTLVIE